MSGVIAAHCHGKTGLKRTAKPDENILRTELTSVRPAGRRVCVRTWPPMRDIRQRHTGGWRMAGGVSCSRGPRILVVLWCYTEYAPRDNLCHIPRDSEPYLVSFNDAASRILRPRVANLGKIDLSQPKPSRSGRFIKVIPKVDRAWIYETPSIIVRTPTTRLPFDALTGEWVSGLQETARERPAPSTPTGACGSDVWDYPLFLSGNGRAAALIKRPSRLSKNCWSSHLLDVSAPVSSTTTAGRNSLEGCETGAYVHGSAERISQNK